MEWSLFVQEFCLQLGFGVLFALAFVPRAPVGTLFYRFMGTVAGLPVLAAFAVRVREGLPWHDPGILGMALTLLAYPLYSGPVRGRRWGVGLGLALSGCGLALALVVREASAPLGVPLLLLAVASVLATGTVAGSVCLSMILGHWYLTIPKLEIRHLARLNRVAIGAMLASGGLCLLSTVAFAELLREGEPPLFGPTGLFYLGTRLTVGLLLPLVFGVMAASALRFRNTRSATGILYASSVLVLIGAALSAFLQDSYRVPL